MSTTQNAMSEASAWLAQAEDLMRAGHFDKAEAQLAQALAKEPDSEKVLLMAARCAVAQERADVARERFHALMKRHPESFSAWLECGNLSRSLGRAQEALRCYRQAVKVGPSRWEGWLTLSRELETMAQFDEAAACYHRALLLAAQHQKSTPQMVRQVHTMMAKYRLDRGDAARALESIRQALSVLRIEQPEPDINEKAQLQIDLGEVLMRLGLAELAHRAFERASLATEEGVLLRLAAQSFHHNLWHEAQEVLKRNVQLHPDSALGLWNLAHSYAESWQMDEAEQTLQQAEALAPQPGAGSMRASIAGRMGDADKALALYLELAQQAGQDVSMGSSAAMSCLYSDKLSAQEVAQLHQKLFSALGRGARERGSFANTREPGRRIKLGLISGDFHHQHPVNIFMQPVLARLDRSQFEVTVYHTGIAYDEQTQLAKSRVDHWVTCTTMTNPRLGQQVEADGIDVLIDLSGHTSLNRVELLAKRIAPVQVSFLGYPCSTGVPNMDWLLADSVVVPPEHDPLCSERVMRLPHTVFCFSPEVDYPYPVYDQTLAQRPLTFGSFNNVPKLTPHTIALWSEILNKVPDARLLLKAPSFRDESAIGVFRKRFEQHGIDPSRIEFRGPVGLTDMMAEYGDVDIALDPVPYNGGTTTLQAMWMGVPVIVKEGHNFVSRMGASFMRSANMPEWVAQSDEAYVDIAARMAKDRVALVELKAGMRQRLQSLPAWNIDAYVLDMQSALRKMWVDFCENVK
jgi:protein O-GlcNAc transferase